MRVCGCSGCGDRGLSSAPDLGVALEKPGERPYRRDPACILERDVAGEYTAGAAKLRRNGMLVCDEEVMGVLGWDDGPWDGVDGWNCVERGEMPSPCSCCCCDPETDIERETEWENCCRGDTF